MRKWFVISSILLLLSVLQVASAAEMKPLPPKGQGVPATDVTVRFSKHEDYVRIVFEAADELFIQGTAVTSSQTQIMVTFPSVPSLKGQVGPGFDTSLRGKVYAIIVPSPFRIKVLKLSSPPRLSIDILLTPKEESSGALPSAPSVNREAENVSRIRIVIDPGHGGYDSGILSGEVREKDVTLSLARNMEAALLKKTRAVYLTRKADQFSSITDRAIFASRKSPDVFISIHLSLSDDFVIYTAPSEPESDSEIGPYRLMSRQSRFADKSAALAEKVGRALKEDFKKEVVFRKMDLPLLASVGAAAIMVEVPRRVASDPGMKTKVSESLLRGIALYAGQ